MGRNDLLLSRRGVGRLAAAALAASGSAPARAQSVSLAVPMPCLSRPDDIVGLVLDGSGAPAGTVVVFGQAFRPGALPRGTGLAARRANGQALPVQADVTTRHPDGSALFAVVSLATPALRNSERAGVILARGGAAAAAPLDVAAAASGRSAVIEIASVGGGTPWQVDLLARMQAVLAQRQPRSVWQSGPLAVQVRVQMPVPPAAVGGAMSARLVADLSLHADGGLWCDAWVRNDIAMRPGGGTARYAMRVLLDGRPALATPPLAQHQYTGFGRLLGSVRAPYAAPPYVRHDTAYLAEAGAVPRYDPSIGIDEELLRSMSRMMAAPDWNQPFSPRGLTTEMEAGGGRGDLGPTTLWQAAWLISGDRRAAAVAVGQAEADGAIPWHFWDPGGGADGSGGWMDTRRWPRFWTDPRGGSPPRTLVQPMPTDTGWGPNRSHQPDLSFVPYLLTGRRAFLDGLTSQGVWGILAQWPETRAESRAFPAVRDVNVVYHSQVRSSAWCMRTLGNAAWIIPDDDAGASYLRAVAMANWSWVRAMTPEWTRLQGEARGWLPGEYGVGGGLPPWQQDFFVSAVAAAARRGNADAQAVLAWMANFIVGRFLAGGRGFNPRDGVTYLIAHSPAQGRTPMPYQTWAEIGAATRERGWSNGNGWQHSQGYYGRLGLQSLAAMSDLLGDEASRRAYAWLRDAAPPFTGPGDLARQPAFAIVPRDMPRVPSRALRCSPASG